VFGNWAEREDSNECISGRLSFCVSLFDTQNPSMGLRIFSGDLKGTSLFSLKGDSIRPTSGRVREAIFNILYHRVSSATVLDLFAGSGALGIEALSRGAQFAIFVDADPSAVTTLRKNIVRCKVQDRSRVFRWDIGRNLHCLAGFAGTFDLVFMDPPYNQGIVVPALKNLNESGVLQKGAVVVVEHGIKEPMQIPGFYISEKRKYGKTLVSLLERVL